MSRKERADGIRNVVLSHTEDNLEVLDIVLNMPQLAFLFGAG